jgi:hypothetical protein
MLPAELYSYFIPYVIRFMNANQISIKDLYTAYGAFASDFFVVARGNPLLPHAKKQADFAVETALWGYKQIRTRRFYWVDKKKLLVRILRSTNIALWQRKREPFFSGGMEVDIICIAVGQQRYWIGGTGNTYASETEKAMHEPEKIIQLPYPGAGLGVDRYTPSWSIHKGEIVKGNVVLCAIVDGDKPQNNSVPKERIVAGWSLLMD